MSKNFFNYSKEVADRFIQSVLFIDDQAFNISAPRSAPPSADYQNLGASQRIQNQDIRGHYAHDLSTADIVERDQDTESPDIQNPNTKDQDAKILDAEDLDTQELANHYHELNPLDLTTAFADKGKLCAILSPKKEVEISSIIEIAKKADIVVLDWKMDLIPESDITEDPEEDADDDDIRGIHTRRIIKSLLQDYLEKAEGVKLVVVYTGERDLEQITNDIHKDLSEKHPSVQITKGRYELCVNRFKVATFAKETLKKSVRREEIVGRIKSYKDLPDVLLDEFTSLTKGLMSNFVLQAISILRENANRLLKVYRPDLDPAYVAHRLMLPDQEDAEGHLVDMVSHSIRALLEYSKSEDVVNEAIINIWIEDQDVKGSINFGGNRSVQVDRVLIKDWLEKNFAWSIDQYNGRAARGNDQIPPAKIRDQERAMHKLKISQYFNNSSDYVDLEFSVLTHHKSIVFLQKKEPVLSLGSIVRNLDKDAYYICIQQRCDSVRIEGQRRFLFLRLDKIQNENGLFNLIVNENNGWSKLKIIYKTHELETIAFKPEDNQTIITASMENEAYVFKSIDGERFIWLADLKDTHAQRIANEYAARLSRVGLDESEWLRRWGG